MPVVKSNSDGAVDHEWLDPHQLPVDTQLKKSSYVSADHEAEETQVPTDDPKQGKQKGRKGRKKLVPVWRLVSPFIFFFFLDCAIDITS